LEERTRRGELLEVDVVQEGRADRERPPKNGTIPCCHWMYSPSWVRRERVQGKVSESPPSVFTNGNGRFWKCSGLLEESPKSAGGRRSRSSHEHDQ